MRETRSLKLRHALILCTGLFLVSTSFAQETAWPTLSEFRDPALQSGLEREIRNLGFESAVLTDRLAVALVDITDPEKPRYAAVNPNDAIYAASLPKIAILLAVFQKAEDGELELDEETLELANDMIRNSSNTAATELLNRIGFAYLADLLESKRYELYDTDTGGGLWVGKAYARSGAWKRDPINNLSHSATVYQVARFYYLLETGRLVSPNACATIKEILSDPAIHHKFVKGLEQKHPGSEIFRKSGTWKDWHADSAIVERDGRRYIAVALVRHPLGDTWLTLLIVKLDALIHGPDSGRS